jgi:hypothetical protein
MKKSFIFQEGKSQKFWETEVKETDLKPVHACSLPVHER